MSKKSKNVSSSESNDSDGNVSAAEEPIKSSPSKLPKYSSILRNLEPDDDVFLLECPTVIDPAVVKGHSFEKLFEAGLLDVFSEEHQQTYALRVTPYTKTENVQICESKTTKKILTLPIQGVINVERKIRLKKCREPIKRNEDVPYPTQLRERHPLLGYQWEKILLSMQSAKAVPKKSIKRKLLDSPQEKQKKRIKLDK